MKNYFKKFSIMFVMSILLMLGCATSAFATDDGVVGTSNLNNTIENSAKVGYQLTAPEKGWKRYDDKNAYVKYSYDTSNGDPNTRISCYKGTYSCVLGEEVYAKFAFKGSKLRITGNRYSSRSDKVVMEIDGIKYRYSCHGDKLDIQNIEFEKLDLENKIHNVKISTDSETTTVANGIKQFDIDAIDINDNGYLLDWQNESISLNKSTDDLQVGQTDTLVATTTPAAVGVSWKSSDESIVTIDSNGKVTGIKEGQATITATTTDGSNLSATCAINITKEIKPTNPSESDNKTGAILIINLNDGETKIFDVSISEIDKFKSWYNTKSEYENKLTYEFNKTVNSNISVEENVVHDKITSYEIRKY
ncbi:hypothetical protein psyc5s11_29860 [Clostridium gelidum]|uniref:BIG2 domain-containing protein n=1 Tax=Clostridium gelidum TaxID=704125 RepID=A0ABN6J2R5_9CLOT|nr:Ig-like domain-containing protein [Clostridium gelidum]BCZ46919.1 hypothetical protein psyc5s11_29860 [Clostridium gelidum]